MEIATDRPALLAQAVVLGVSVSHKHKTTIPCSVTTLALDLAITRLPRPLLRLEQAREDYLVAQIAPLARVFSAPLPQQLHSRQEVSLELRMLGQDLGLEVRLLLEDLARTLDFLEILRKQQRHLSRLVRHPQLGLDLEEEEGLGLILRLPREEVCLEPPKLSRLSDRSQRPQPLTCSEEEISSRLLVDLEPEPMLRKLEEGCSVAPIPLREVISLGVQIRPIQLLALSGPTTTTKHPAQASSVQSQWLLAQLHCLERQTARLIPPVRRSLAPDSEITIIKRSRVLLAFSEITISSNQSHLCLAIPLEAATVICSEPEIAAALSSITQGQITIRIKLGKVCSRIPPTAMETVFSVARSKMCSKLRNP